MPLVSIIIPAYNRVALTQQCLDSLRTTVDLSAEIIVVDNGSRDGTDALLRSLGSSVRRIRNAENLGFAPACNQGARAAMGEYLVFLNNDTIALPGWLGSLVDTAQASPTVAVVGSRLLYSDGTIQHAGVVMSRVFRSPCHIHRQVDGNHPAVNYLREFRAVTGACMLIRRGSFESAGGFDEGFRNGFEDVDLCLRVRSLGGRIFYQPRSVLYHLESQTPGRSAHEGANLSRFQARWGGPQWADEDLCYFQDGMRYHTVIDNGELTTMPRPIRDEEEHARYGELARVQAHLHLDGYAPAETVISAPERWVLEPSVLEWGELICEAFGLFSLAEQFRTRAEWAGNAPLGATGLPWASRSQSRQIRAGFFSRISAEDVPAVPLWPPNIAGRMSDLRNDSSDIDACERVSGASDLSPW